MLDTEQSRKHRGDKEADGKAYQETIAYKGAKRLRRFLEEEWKNMGR
jgi:hypothetical protein